MNSIFKTTKKFDDITWDYTAYKEIIDYIVNTHHSYLYSELPAISEGIDSLIEEKDTEFIKLSMVKKLFDLLREALENHLLREEKDAFPIILRCLENPTEDNLNMLMRVLTALEEDHGESKEVLNRIRQVTADYQLSKNASDTLKLVYQKLQELEADHDEHVRLEDDLLFAQLMEKEIENLKNH